MNLSWIPAPSYHLRVGGWSSVLEEAFLCTEAPTISFSFVPILGCPTLARKKPKHTKDGNALYKTQLAVDSCDHPLPHHLLGRSVVLVSLSHIYSLTRRKENRN